MGDLEADFLRFYGIEDITELDGPKFFRLAWRVPAFGGVMTRRVHEQQPSPEQVTAQRPAPAPAPQSEVVPLASFMAEHAGLGDWRRVTNSSNDTDGEVG